MREVAIVAAGMTRFGELWQSSLRDLFVEAAGNYVTFHTAARSYLVRGTLAAWDGRLAARGFVRVHRSHLVNRAHIASFKPTASGDLEITLDSGRTLAGSRRYREALEAARAP